MRSIPPKELRDIVAALEGLAPGEKAVMATVVATSGFTYRRTGARMLITKAGKQIGAVSGGCLEGDLLATGWERTKDGPVLATFDASQEGDILWGFGLGCNGVVQVLLQQVTATDPGPAALIAAVRLRRSCTLSTLRAEGPDSVGSPVLVENIQPSPRLMVFGAGYDAIPVVRLAASMGWHVAVVDHRQALLTEERLPWADELLTPGAPVEDCAAALVMSHNYHQDLAALKTILPAKVGYVGILGPKVRTERLLRDLCEAGITLDDPGRLHSPVGLDIGASGPDEIALAVVAELQRYFTGTGSAVFSTVECGTSA